MRIRPTGLDLLSTARTVLVESLLSHIPSAELPAARGVGRAMAIAAHELELRRPAQPADLEMLQAARKTLRERLLGCLPKERQYDARLIAKAIAIATVELAHGDDPEREELARLTTLMDATPSSAGDARDVRAQLEANYARLSAEIRAGRMDPGTTRYTAIYQHLRDTNREALSESHPEYLASRSAAALEQKAAI